MFTHAITLFAASCTGGGFLGFPTWYAYLPGTTGPDNICSPQLTNINDIWLIAAAFIEILLRVAGLVALAFVIFGGFTFMTSQGDPGKAAQGRTTILNALAGLVVAVMAAVVVGFIAKSIS